MGFGVLDEGQEVLSPSAVLTEDGQTCRFPFRYGSRMFHSCTLEGSTHRKWWVGVRGPSSVRPHSWAEHGRQSGDSE